MGTIVDVLLEGVAASKPLVVLLDGGFAPVLRPPKPLAVFWAIDFVLWFQLELKRTP